MNMSSTRWSKLQNMSGRFRNRLEKYYIISYLSFTCADRCSRIVLTCVAGTGIARKSSTVCRCTGEAVGCGSRTRRACVRASWSNFKNIILCLLYLNTSHGCRRRIILRCRGRCCLKECDNLKTNKFGR